jgi:hypothetical protein
LHKPSMLLPLTLTRVVEVAAPRTAAVGASTRSAAAGTGDDSTSMVHRPVAPSCLEESSSLDSKVLTSWRRRRRRRRASRSRARRAPQAEPAASALSVVCCRLPAVEAALPHTPPSRARRPGAPPSVWMSIQPHRPRFDLHCGQVGRPSCLEASSLDSKVPLRRHPLVFILGTGAAGPCCDCR